jgi:hypothetical protein
MLHFLLHEAKECALLHFSFFASPLASASLKLRSEVEKRSQSEAEKRRMQSGSKQSRKEKQESKKVTAVKE